MPDWSYRTVLRPLLFRLSPSSARDLSLTLMGTLGRSPWGPAVIDFMGHMRAPEGLRCDVAGSLGIQSALLINCRELALLKLRIRF